VKVHIGIAEATASEGVTTDTDRGHGTDLVKDFEDDTFSDIAVKLTHVE
jgi:hypothetical protein